MDSKHIVNFFFELGQLKRIRHEGWRVAGVDDPGTVGAHALRAAQIGYVLAMLEGYENPQEVATMLVFHDIGECRIGDIHKIANRYVTANEEQAVLDQLRELEKLGEDIFKLWHEAEHDGSPAGIIAKDADVLEMVVTAKEYMEIGYAFAELWIKKAKENITTQSAKKLIEEIEKTSAFEWSRNLSKHNKRNSHT